MYYSSYHTPKVDVICHHDLASYGWNNAVVFANGEVIDVFIHDDC